MKSAWPLILLVCVMATSPAALSQALYPPARDILNAERLLQPTETAAVLAAVREAISGKTFRLSYVANGPGPEVLMGTNGRPRFVRAISGYDYRSGAVGAMETGTERSPSKAGTSISSHSPSTRVGRPASVTEPRSTTSSSSSMNTKARMTVGL